MPWRIHYFANFTDFEEYKKKQGNKENAYCTES